MSGGNEDWDITGPNSKKKIENIDSPRIKKKVGRRHSILYAFEMSDPMAWFCELMESVLREDSANKKKWTEIELFKRYDVGALIIEMGKEFEMINQHSPQVYEGFLESKRNQALFKDLTNKCARIANMAMFLAAIFSDERITDN